MFIRISLLIILLNFSFLAFGQDGFDQNDFFELGYAHNSRINSDYLLKSKYRVVDTITYNKILCGYTPHYSYQMNLRYGKAITPYTNLILGVDYTKRKQQGNGAIFRNKEIVQEEPVVFHRISCNIGTRLNIVQTEKIEVGIEGGGQVVHTIGAPKDLIAGYYGRGIVGYNINERIQVNAKYGYQSTVGKYLYSSRPVELALHYKIL